jgi:hypothetical protein
MRPPVPTHPEDDRLLELAYGEAPDAEARALHQHVDGCARCKQVLEGIADVRTAFRSIPAEPAPERGLESLLAYGEQAAARARSRRGGLRILIFLSAAAAFAVVWLLLPSSHRPPDGLARSTVSPPSDSLAQAEAPRAPAQGNRARDEADDQAKDEKGRELKALVQQPASKEESQPARRAEPHKQKGNVKLDAPAEQPKIAAATPVGTPAEVEGAGRSAAASSGALGNATASAGKVGAAGAGVAATGAAHSSETLAMKRSAANRADSSEKALAAPPPASFEAATPPAAMRGADARAQQAAKIAAAPVADAVADQDKIIGASKLAPAMQSMRMGAGSPEKQARLAEIDRQLASAKGDQRKALLMEKCEIQASLQLGPDAVVTCSRVSQEFPGTPEAKRASDLARGFSVQLPAKEER